MTTESAAARRRSVTTYKESGVDIEAKDALVERIKPVAERTHRPELLSGVGGFGGLFALPPGKYREPVLVALAGGEKCRQSGLIGGGGRRGGDSDGRLDRGQPVEPEGAERRSIRRIALSMDSRSGSPP